jgi:hypothetical protein
MTTILVSFFCKIDAIEHIRTAVCAAKEYERETALYAPAPNPHLSAIDL